MEHIKDHEGLQNKEILEDMMNNYGMSKRSVQKALAYAVKKEKLFKRKFGRCMHYFSNEMNAKAYVPKKDEDASIKSDETTDEVKIANNPTIVYGEQIEGTSLHRIEVVRGKNEE